MTSTRQALAQLRDANPVPPTTPIARPSRTSRRRFGSLVGAAAGLAALAFLFGIVPLPWTHGSATPAAAAALDQAATAADITAQDPAARPDQYWRIRTVGTTVSFGGTSDAWRESVERDDYVAVDGDRATWTASGAGTVLEVISGPAPGAGATASTWTTDLAPNEAPGTWQAPSPAWLSALPRDTQALRSRLYDETSGHGRSHDGEVLVHVADVLRSGLVPADLRAALYRVLETVPGVDIVRRHDDGRISIGRLETKDGERQEVIIDPGTGAYLGDRIVQVEALGALPAGTVTAETQVTATVVDEVPDRVRAAAQHFACVVQDDGGVMCGS